MAKLTESRELRVVAGVAVLLSGLGGGGVWWAQGLVEEKRDTLATMRTEIEQAVEKIRAIPKVEREVIVLREDFYDDIKILPDLCELGDFLRLTQQFQAQSKVVVQQFTPGRGGRAGKGSPFERFTYRFQLQATLWQFLEFMNLFENHEWFVQVVELALEPGPGRAAAMGPDVVHKITITVETYGYKPTTPDFAIANYKAKVAKIREEEGFVCEMPSRGDWGYRFRGKRGRRDIFVDPRQAVDRRVVGSQLSSRQQREIIARMAEKLEECRRIYERLQDPGITIFERYALERTVRQLIVQVQAEVNAINDRGFISDALQPTWSREVVEPLAQLKSRAAEKTRR